LPDELSVRAGLLVVFSLACAAQSVDSKAAQGYIERAYALVQQARDASKPALYTEASGALDRALEASPGNYEALRLRVAVLLAVHDFPEALRRAKELNKKVPDDTTVWGYLVDANMGLGDYEEAEKDAQWILDLRRGSMLGFVKAAALREVFGDTEGAIEFYNEALLRMPAGEKVERSWLMTRNGRLQMAAGNTGKAKEYLDSALAIDPESQDALAGLAALAASQGNYAEAVRIAKKRVEQSPGSGNTFDLAVMLERGGQTAEAETEYRAFETMARAEMGKTLNSNRELVFYYADHRNDAAQALTIAAKEADKRHDSATLDAYAWALFRSGKLAEARTQMDKALAPGVRDSGYFCHALQIAKAMNDGAAVERFGKACPDSPAITK
jgi:tetratricopeptide (TPR) repeat protein